MYGFPVGIISPESVLADQNDLFPAFATDFKKTGNMSIFPQNQLNSHLLVLNRKFEQNLRLFGRFKFSRIQFGQSK